MAVGETPGQRLLGIVVETCFQISNRPSVKTVWQPCLLGGRRAYIHVVLTYKMEVAFLLHSFRRSSSSSVTGTSLGVALPTETISE